MSETDQAHELPQVNPEPKPTTSPNHNGEKFNNITSGIQNIMLSIAIVIGGFWTYRTFDELVQAPTAKAELEKVKAELEKAKKDLKRTAVIDVRLTAQQEAIPGNNSKYISALAEIKNLGNGSCLLDFTKGNSLRVSEIQFDENDDMIAGSPRNAEVPQFKINVRPGSTQGIPFFTPVKKPGLYFLVFRVDVSCPDEDDELKGIGMANPSRATWSASSYFVVR